MVILVQIGRKKTRTWFHSISAKLIIPQGDVSEISWTNFDGQWLSPPVSRDFESFYMAEVPVETGDKIELVTFVKKPQGVVENLSLKETYIVNESYDVAEFTVKQLGYKGYPLLKGRLEKVTSRSKLDERDAQSRFKFDHTEF